MLKFYLRTNHIKIMKNNKDYLILSPKKKPDET